MRILLIVAAFLIWPQSSFAQLPEKVCLRYINPQNQIRLTEGLSSVDAKTGEITIGDVTLASRLAFGMYRHINNKKGPHEVWLSRNQYDPSIDLKGFLFKVMDEINAYRMVGSTVIIRTSNPCILDELSKLKGQLIGIIVLNRL